MRFNVGRVLVLNDSLASCVTAASGSSSGFPSGLSGTPTRSTSASGRGNNTHQGLVSSETWLMTWLSPKPRHLTVFHSRDEGL
jgi:hypothetical protein